MPNQAYGLNRNAYVNHIVCNNSFYDMMYIVMDKIIKIDGKVLVYIATNSAIDIVKAWIEENYPEFKDNIEYIQVLLLKISNVNSSLRSLYYLQISRCGL